MKSLQQEVLKITVSAFTFRDPWRRRQLLLRVAAGSLALVALLLLRTYPARAVDNVTFFCNGTSGPTCDTFQLDGAGNPTASADTCVGGEFACPSEEDPVWPADWDALLYPSLTSASPAITPVSGTPPGPWVFSLPWGKFGSFSGIFTSALVSTGTSQILKQGSKNNADISTWVVASQSSPPKDAYLAGALATYIAPSANGVVKAGDELLYFGSTRFKPQGSAAIGIWLFQQNVMVCPNGTQLCNASTGAVATHQNGDVFLFISFGGSGTATIQDSTWVGNGTSGSLGPPNTLVTCPATGDQACAITNELNSITLGMSATAFQAPGQGFNVNGPGFAGFTGGVVPALQFEEGGIDLNSIFSSTAPCFSSVLFASVTSGSAPGNASLKSILLGSFNTCAISATKACGTGSFNGSKVTFPISGSIKNEGGGAVDNFVITDSPALDSAATCFYPGVNGNPSQCSGTPMTPVPCNSTSTSLNPGATLCYQGSWSSSTQNGGADTISVSSSGSGGGLATATALANPACAPVALSSSIFVTKNCNVFLVPSGSGLGVEVDVSGTVSNIIPSSCTNSSNTTCTTDADCSLAGEECQNPTGGANGGKCILPCGSNTDCTAPATCGTPSTTNLDTLNNVAVADSANGQSVSVGNLAPGASASYSYTYNPKGVCSNSSASCTKNSDCGTGATCLVSSFTDTVTASGICKDTFVCGSQSVSDTASATCPLCPPKTK